MAGIEQLIVELRADLSQFRREMQQATQIAQQVGQRSQQSMTGLNQSIGTLGTSLRGVNSLLGQLGIGLSGVGIALFVRQTIDASKQQQAFTLSLKAATGSLTVAKQELAFVRQEANRLGQDVVTASRQFVALTNATKGTSLAGAATREIFSAVSEAATVLGLSTEQYGQALTAVSQIAQKGKVQQEELLQLAEAGIPVQRQLAQALGKTTEELAKMMEQGRVGRDALLPLARVMRQDLGGAVTEASQLFAAAQARIGTAINQLRTAFGDMITKSPPLVQALNDLGSAILALAEVVRKSKDIQGFFQFLATGAEATVRGVTRALQQTPEQLKQITALTEAIQKQQTILEDLKKTQANPVERFIFEGTRIPGLSRSLSDEIQHVTTQLLDLQQKRAALMQQSSNMQREFATGSLVEGPEGASLGLFDTARSRETILASSKPLQELKQLQADIAAGKKILSMEGLGLSREQAAAIRADLESLQEKLQKLGEVSVPKDLQQFRQLTRDIAEVQAALKKFPEGSADAQILTRSLFDMQEKARELGKTFKQEVVEAGLEAFGEAMGDLEGDIDEGKKSAQEFQDKIDAINSAPLEALGEAWADLDKDMQDGIALAKEFVLRQFELSTESIRGVEAWSAALQQLEQDLRRVGVGQVEIEKTMERQSERAKRSLEETSREFERFAKKVQDTIADQIFDVLSGQINSIEDLLDSLKDTFLRVLSEMAAAAIAKPIAIAVTTSFGGALGSLFGLGSGQAGAGQQVPVDEFGRLGTAAIQGSGLQTSGAKFNIGKLNEQNALAAAGFAFAGSELGAFTGSFAGLGDTGSERLGQEVGAGVLGAVGGILGGQWGAAIGAFLGNLLGGAIGSLFNKKPPKLALRDSADVIPSLEFQEGLGVRFDRPVQVRPGARRRLDQEEITGITDSIEAVTSGMLEAVFQQVSRIPVSLQERLAGPLNTLLDEFEQTFKGVEFSGKDIAEEVQEFIETTVPAAFSRIFGQFDRIFPLLENFGTAITALEQQQATVLGHIASARDALITSLQTPAEQFVARQGELQGLLTEFDTASAAEQVRLVPEITALIQQVIQLAQQEGVLGQDIPLLRQTQEELLGILAELETTTRETFGGQITAAEQQVDILLDLKTITAAKLDTANEQLARIAQFLSSMQQPLVGSFQQGGTVPRTGLAMVHQGETVTPAGQHTASPLNITINVSGNTPDDISRQVLDRIIPQLRARQRFGQF